MRPLYEKKDDDLEIYRKENSHFPPHVHGNLEFIYLESGSFDIGIEKTMYHLEPGDLAAVFPGQIHYYQNFSGQPGSAIYLIASPSLCGSYRTQALQNAPSYPVLRARELDADIPYMMSRMATDEADRRRERARLKRLKQRKKNSAPPFNEADIATLNNAYFDIIFMRYLMSVTLVERKVSANEDLVYRMVLYVAENFTKEFSLTDMAQDLYVSQFELSRIFASVFHMNFNSYVNESRLDYAANLLRQTDTPITEVMYSSGFGSQRTFNRVFKDKYHMTPRDYRNQNSIS